MNKSEFVEAINTQGYWIEENVLSAEFISRSKGDLLSAIEHDAKTYGPAGKKDYGMVLLCSLHGGSFNELFDNEKLMQPFNWILGDNCIVYAYTSSSMPPSKGNYSTRIHVDCPRLIPGYVTNMGATIALDDFTMENGATYFLPRSQHAFEQPSQEEFNEKSKRFIAPAGSVLFFNARLWHAGGENATQRWRHALTINMCRSYMKQRIDVPRAMSSKFNADELSRNCRQKLGYFSQPPTSLNEYYLPPELRNFKHSAE